jgi:hypothetical protein
METSTIKYYDGEILEVPNIKTERLGRNKQLHYYKDVFGGYVMKFNMVIMKNRLD